MKDDDPKIRVLIVDDEEIYRQIVSSVLRKTKTFEFESSDSGRDAMKKLEQSTFDVIILDYRMTEGSGLNVLQWMLEQKNDTPVIMLTGAGSENIAVEAMKLGAYDYVRKDQMEPQHLPVLIQGVHERHLFRKEKERQSDISRESNQTLVLLGSLQKSISTISDALNSNLTMVSLTLGETQKNLESILPSKAMETTDRAFGQLKEQYELIAAIAKSMQSLVNLMFTRFAGTVQNAESLSQIQTLTRQIEQKENH